MRADDLLVVAVGIGAVAVWLLYLLPSLVAFARRHPNRWAILAVNLFLGATGIGWAAALVWALHAAHRTTRPGGSNGGESGVNLFVNDVRSVQLVGGPVPGWSEPPGEARVGPAMTVGQAVAQLERLDRLRASGDLDAAEHAALKRDLLARLSTAHAWASGGP